GAWTGSRFWSWGGGMISLLSPCIQAPRARARGGKVEPDETVKRQGYAVVHDGPEAHGEGELEVPHRHLTGEEEGEWAGEEAQQEQRTTDRLDNPGKQELEEHRRRAAIRGHADGEREQLHRAGQDEHERGHD